MNKTPPIALGVAKTLGQVLDECVSSMSKPIMGPSETALHDAIRTHLVVTARLSFEDCHADANLEGAEHIIKKICAKADAYSLMLEALVSLQNAAERTATNRELRSLVRDTTTIVFERLNRK